MDPSLTESSASWNDLTISPVYYAVGSESARSSIRICGVRTLYGDIGSLAVGAVGSLAVGAVACSDRSKCERDVVQCTVGVIGSPITVVGTVVKTVGTVTITTPTKAKEIVTSPDEI